MCFSAAASFTAASILGTAGLVTLSRVRRIRDLPLAGVPLLFAAQQAIEGALWLALPGDASLAGGGLAGWLANGFALIALVNIQGDSREAFAEQTDLIRARLLCGSVLQSDGP